MGFLDCFQRLEEEGCNWSAVIVVVVVVIDDDGDGDDGTAAVLVDMSLWSISKSVLLLIIMMFSYVILALWPLLMPPSLSH